MSKYHFKIVERLDGQREASVLVDPQYTYLQVPHLMYEACMRAGANNCVLAQDDIAAIKENSILASNWTTEKRRDIWEQCLNMDEPSQAIALFAETGLLDHLLPELKECQGIEQNSHHKYDVFWHLLKACDYAPKEELVLRWVGLLHDIGKPETRIENIATGEYSFPAHEDYSAAKAKYILDGLGYDEEFVNLVVCLIEQHMIGYNEKWKDAAVRRFIRRVGEDNVKMLLEVARADALAHLDDGDSSLVDELEERINTIEMDPQASKHELNITGYDIMEIGQIPPGPEVGEAIKYLEEAVDATPEINNEEDLKHLTYLYFEAESDELGNWVNTPDIDSKEEERIRKNAKKFLRRYFTLNVDQPEGTNKSRIDYGSDYNTYLFSEDRLDDLKDAVEDVLSSGDQSIILGFGGCILVCPTNCLGISDRQAKHLRFRSAAAAAADILQFAGDIDEFTLYNYFNRFPRPDVSMHARSMAISWKKQLFETHVLKSLLMTEV